MVISYHETIYITIDVENDNIPEFYKIKNNLITKESYLHKTFNNHHPIEHHKFTRLTKNIKI
jgi:hypothetical protein